MTSTEHPPKNHLAGERSLYLKQHSGNPLDWYPWGEDAFEKARTEDKLIVLSIGYSSCYWCHVMEDEVFSQRDVAEFVNPRFVCIKVDREERPDIDATYMEAARLMTGGGGWPLNLWLTPDLRPVYAGTYFPKEHFLAVCEQLHNAWQSDRAQFDSVGSQIVAAVNAAVSQPKPGSITSVLLDRAAQVILAHGDPQWGGLTSRVKFPEPVLWEFLLHYYVRTRSSDVLSLLTVTLGSMADGGLYDHVGGGFHRYSTDRQWLVPHFEKMLYDNAQLASLYLDAARVLEEPRYASVARDTLDFMLRELRIDSGAFAASFDASTSEGEGAYYVWTPQQLHEVAGDDASDLARQLGVSDAPSFRDHHGRVSGSVVTLRFGNDAELFANYRDKLREVRAKRLPPVRDDKVVTAWNAMAISALAKGGELEAAQRAADYLWNCHRLPGGSLCRTSNHGELGPPAILEDYALFAKALLDLHELNPYGTELQRALELIAYVRENFAHPERVFFQTTAITDLPFARQVNLTDTVEPSGNSVMAHVLLKAALLTGDLSLYESAGALLEALAGHAQEQPLESGHMLSAAGLLIGPHCLAVVSGEQLAAGGLAGELRRTPALNYSVIAVDPERFAALPDALRNLQPVLHGKPAIDGKPTVYVCQHGTCSAPVHDAAAARELLLMR